VPGAELSIAAGNTQLSIRPAGGRDHSGPAQQRPDADDGEFRHARRCAGWQSDGSPALPDMLFQSAKPPKGDAPTDTLTAAEAIARNPVFAEQALRIPTLLSGSDGKNRCLDL
jgi:hypothetical protein